MGVPNWQDLVAWLHKVAQRGGVNRLELYLFETDNEFEIPETNICSRAGICFLITKTDGLKVDGELQ